MRGEVADDTAGVGLGGVVSTLSGSAEVCVTLIFVDTSVLLCSIFQADILSGYDHRLPGIYDNRNS